MPNNIPIKQGTLSKIPVPSTIGTPIGNTGYGTSKYDAKVNYQDALYNLEEFRHNNQSSLDVIGNSLAHFAGSAVNAGLEIPAIAFGALKAPFVGWSSLAKGEGLANAEVDAFNAYFDNEISRQVVDPINQWFQDTFKVYSSQKQKDSNFFSYENLTSGHFLDALLSGAGYTAGSFVTGAALTKAFGLAKIAATGAKVGESAESLIAEAANTAKKSIPINLRSQLAIGTIMAGMESSLEARQTKDQILQELKNVSNLTDAQKQDIAESGSLANFAFNMGILVPTNSLVFGRLIRPGGDAIESGIKTAFNAEGKIIEKQIANKYLRTATKIIKNPITESLIEEGGQEYLQFASNAAINDYLDNKYNGRNASILSSIGSALYEGIATKEGLENTVIGGLMGVVAGGTAHIRNGKEEADRKKAQLDYINKNLPKALDVIKDKILDADRSITYQQNMDQNIAESSKENKFNYYNNKHSALVSLVQQHLNAGTLGILVDRIKGLKTASKEEINKLFGNEITQADLERWDIDDTINSLVKDITNIKSIHENVQRILPNPYNLKTQPKEYFAFKDLQNLLTHTASTIDNTTARIHNINEQLNRFGITFNNTLYNNLTKEEKKSYLESTKKEIEDTNPVHHAHLNKELNDILNLNKRKEVFTEAYKTLSSEKGSKETLEKINALQKEKEQPKTEVKKEEKPPVPPNPENEFNSTLKFQGSDTEVQVKYSGKDSNGFPIYIDEKGNEYSEDKNPNIYIKGSSLIEKGQREELKGVEHFSRLHKTRLADDLYTGNLEAFSIKFNQKLQSIAQLPDWKSHIQAVVVKGNPESHSLINKPKELKGNSGNINILLSIDGELGFQALNPDYYSINGKVVDFEKISLTEFNKYFSNQGQKDFTKLQFESIQASWKALKEFNDAVTKWYSTQVSEDKIKNIEKKRQEKLLGGFKINDSRPIKNGSKPQTRIKVNSDGTKITFEGFYEDEPNVGLNAEYPKMTLEEFRNSEFYKNLKPESREQLEEIISDNEGNVTGIALNEIRISKNEGDFIGKGNSGITITILTKAGNINHILLAMNTSEINAKYDAELAALENQKSPEVVSDGSATPTTVEAQKADIERRRQEELDKETPLKNENITVDFGGGVSVKYQVITYKDGSVKISTVDEKAKRYNELSDEVFKDYAKIDFKSGAKGIIKTELIKDDYTDKQSQEIKAAKEKTINAKYDAELATLKNNSEEVPLPKEALDYLLSGSIFWDKALPLDSKEFGDTFKDSPIVLGTNPTVSTNGKSLENITADLAYDLAFQIDEKFRKSYFVLAKLVNGLQRWIRIQAKETTAENVLSKLKEVQSDINKLTSNPTKEQADIITDKLDFWIASKPGNTIKFVHNFKLSGKLQLALGYGTNSKITDRVLLPDISNWEEKDLIDFINSILEPKGFEKVDISHFKQEIVPTGTNIDQFEVKVNPQILKDYTLLFKFNPEALGQTSEVKTQEIPKEVVKTEEVQKNLQESKYPEELEAQIILARMAGYSEKEIEDLIKDWYNSNKDYNKTKVYSDESQLSTEPRTYAEITQRLREQVPQDIGIDRLDRILSTLNINGVPVGIFRDSTVFISEKMGYSDADHEAFHTIFNTVLTPVEQERYLKAKKRELNYTPEQLNSEVQQMLSERPDLIQLLKLKEITRQDVENLVVEEKLADDYADKRNSKELNKPTSWKQAIFNLFDKIVNFFTKNVKILDLFNQIDKGAFVNSKIQVPNKLSSLVKAKLIGELTAEQSRNLISLVSAKYTNYNNTVSLERIVDELIEEYNPFSEGNIALVKSRNTELERANLKKFLRVNNFALKNNKALIIDESTKYLKYLNFNPKKTEEDNFEIETDKDMKEFDRLDSEIPTLDRVSQEIKAFIGSTIYKTTFYGKEVETAVHFSEVYNKLLSILTNTETSKVLSTIKALGTKDIQMNALYNKLHNEKGYSKDSPKGITFEDEMFLTRFIKQFELARIPYVSVFTKDDKYLVKKTNKDDAGSYTFDQWSTAFSLNIDDKLIGDSEFRNELQYNLTLLISKLQDKPISDKWKYKNYLKSTAIKDILSSIEIDLNKEYLETLFDNTDEDSTILRDLITKENRNITVQDIYKLQDILLNNTSDTSEGKDNRNPFLDSQMSDRLLAISTGSSQFDNNFIIPNYRASDNTLRYTYVPYSYYSQSIQEIKDKYKNYQDIPTKVSDYLRYNPMFNSENRDLILQNISNLEITYIGDNTFDEGKTYKDSNEQDILRVLYGLFQNKDPKKQTYITAPSIIADKRSFYGIQVPFRNLWEKGELTEEGKELLKGLFTQEFKRLQGDFPNTNKNIFLYLPVFNNTNILDKIKSTSDINKYFESDILPILRNFIDSEVNNLKIEGVQLEKNDTYQFILNNLINNISIQQLTEGDLSQLSYKDLGTWEKSYNKLFSERFKRESSLNASGLNMGEGEDKVQYTEDTQAWVNKDTGEVQYNKPEDKELDKFHPKPINPDDAQVWQTPLGRLRDMQSLGKLTELHYSALEKLNGLVLDKNGNPEYPTKEELKNLDLISSKHVTSGFDTQGNRVYYKMSISPLIPWDLGYWSVVDKEWKPKKGFEEGFNRWKLMNDKNLDLLVPKSASKVFFGNIGETYSVPRKYRREQVLKESKSTNKVPWLTQIQQLIDFGLLDNEKNNVLRETLQDIQVQLRNNTFNFLKDQIVGSNGNLKEDLSFFLQKLRDTVESTTPDIQSIELLKSTFGKLDYTLNLAHTRNKMEQIFLSHFKDAFQHKLNGAKLTMRSPIVYKAIRDEKGNVIPGAERNSEKYKDYELSDLRVTWENSNPEGEIVISAFTANKLGLKIGDTVVSLRVPTQGYNFMGRSKIADILPEYMGDIVIAAPQLTLYAGQDFDDDSLYIFSKEKYNTLRGEILYGEEETLEERWEGYKNWYINNNQDFRLYLKNLVDNHKELQGLQNLDEILDTSSQTAVQIYDSLVQDTLKFFNLPSSITDYQLKNEPLSQGALNNELIKNLEEIIQQPELEKYFKQASTTDETKKTKEKIEKILGTDSLTLSMFTPSGLMKAWDDNTASTNLRGSTVLAQTTGANLTKNRVNLNPEYWITFNGITYKSFNTPDDVTYLKNNYSSEKVSTSIDNSKDPMASTFHWTKNNVSVFSYLNQLGINIKDGDGILSVQPSIIQASKVKPFALRYELRNWEQEYRTKFNEEVQGDNLTSKELWYSLEPSNRGTKEFYQTQIKALRLYMKASEIASFGFNISRLNTLTRTIGSSFDDARGFLNSYTELTVPKLNKKGEIIPNPFNTDKLLKREKNIINNVKNLETVLEIAKELFISETDTVRDIQNTLLKSLKAKKEGLHERVQKSLNTYLQMQIYKTLNPKVDFTGLITDSLKGSKKENLITSKFKNLMKYPEFTQNKFIKFLKPLEQGQKGNNTPLSILKFDSVTVPTKELSELFLDSVNSMYHSENPEIAQFAVDLLNYQAALGNMEFLNNSFMRFIPVVLLKDLAQNFQRLNTELAKPNPSEEIIKKITGKTSEELKKEFITNYLSNLNNSSDINSIPKEYKPLIQNYRFSTEVFGTDYKKPWLDTPERNKELSDWLLTLMPKVDKSNPEPNNSDNIPDDSSNEEIPEDNLDNPKILSKLEENNEIMEIDFQEEQTSGYRNRTIKNASADATIAIAVDFNSAGEKLTKSSVLNQKKLYIPLDANSLVVTQDRVNKIVQMLNSVKAKTLNIAGNGIYTMKGRYTQEQIDNFTYELLNKVLNSPLLINKIESIRSGGQTGFDEAGAKAGIKLGLPTIVLAPKEWTFRNINGQDISNEQQFKDRFKNISQVVDKNQLQKQNIKEGVKELFKSNPELANVGTQQQYSAYLDTIFPDSKVKDIVYHFSKDKNKQDFKNTKSALSKETDGSIHFGTLEQAQSRESNIERELFESQWDNAGKKTAKDYAKELYNKPWEKLTTDEQAEVIYLEQIDSENTLLDNLAKIKEGKIYPALINSTNIREFSDAGLNNFNFKNIDTVKYLNKVEAGWNPNYSFAVKNPEQIYILGSKKDIEGFKRFVNKNISQVKQNITPEQQKSISDLRNIDSYYTEVFKNKHDKNLENLNISSIFNSGISDVQKIKQQLIQEGKIKKNCK